MKKCCPAIILVLLLSAVCSGMAGCGNETASLNGDNQTSQKTVSENAVSAASISEQSPSPAKGTCCTAANLYIAVWTKTDLPDNAADSDFVASDPGQTGLVQMRLDGSCKKKIDLGPHFSSLISVAGSWIYYTTKEQITENEDVIEIWRVPVWTDPDGFDHVETGRTEKLIGGTPGEVYDESNIFADENFLLYFRNLEKDDEEKIVVYDLQKHEEIRSGFGEIPCNSDSVLCLWRLGEQYAVLMDDDLMVMPADASGWKQVLNSDYMQTDYETYSNRFLFYECFPTEEDECDYTPGPDHMNRDTIRVCDGKTDRGFVTRKELKKAVENAVRTTENFTVEELGEWDILNLFCEDDRCYIQVQVTGTHNKIYYMDTLVFSKPAANGTLRYEEKLTKAMRECGKEWEGKWYTRHKKQKKVIIEHSKINPAYCSDAVNGKIYFTFYPAKNDIRMGCYDTDTGLVSEITSKDPVFYERYYNGEPEDEGIRANDVTEEIEEWSVLPDEDALFEIMLGAKEN